MAKESSLPWAARPLLGAWRTIQTAAPSRSTTPAVPAIAHHEGVSACRRARSASRRARASLAVTMGNVGLRAVATPASTIGFPGRARTAKAMRGSGGMCFAVASRVRVRSSSNETAPSVLRAGGTMCSPSRARCRQRSRGDGGRSHRCHSLIVELPADVGPEMVVG